MVYRIKGILLIFAVIEHYNIIQRSHIVAVPVIRNSKNQPLVKSIRNIVFNDLKTLCHNRLG